MAELGRSRVVAAGDRAGPRQARRVPRVRPPGPPPRPPSPTPAGERRRRHRHSGLRGAAHAHSAFSPCLFPATSPGTK